MLANIGWGEMLLLVVIGLVVLGPERLPGALSWAAAALRRTRDYLSSASSALREDFGSEFDDLRKPLAELNQLRGMNPRAALTKHILDGDDSWLSTVLDAPAPPSPPASAPVPASQAAPSSAQQPRFDSDAT